MHIIKKYWLIMAGVAAGLAGGYMYWHEVGCVSGTCPITSSPLNSSLYGAFMGGLLFSMFRKQSK